MADEVIHISDGESHCRVVDATNGTVQAFLRQISMSGAVLDEKAALKDEEALDLTVVLKGLQPRQFFASVTKVGPGGIHLQWMHVDGSEQQRLKSLLEAYRTLNKPGGPPEQPPEKQHERQATRRIIKPRESQTAIMPFADTPGSAVVKSNTATAKSAGATATATPTGTPVSPAARKTTDIPAAAATPAPAPTPAAPTTMEGAQPKGPSSPTSTSERIRTRRLVRPSKGRMPAVEDITPFSDESKPSAKAASTKGKEPASEPRESPGVQNIFPSEDSGSQIALTDMTPSGAARIIPPEGADTSEEQEEPASADGKAGIIGSDGRMDIGASIRSRARSVRASDLAARHDRVRVLNMGTIKQLIQEAVEEASHHLTRSLSEADRKRLLEEAEEGFKERLKAFEAEKLGAEQRLKRLGDQLTLAQQTLEQERKRSIKADQFTVSATGLDEIESKFKRLLEHSINEGRVVPALEDELRKVIATVFDQERQRIREQELKAQNEKINLLESKIKRLSTSLEDTERQRDEMQEWARMVEASGGGALRNVFTAGLKDNDPNKKRKMALMKEILDINRSIRKELGIDTVAVDEQTLEAIKKSEADSVLTAEEQEQIQAQRKQKGTRTIKKPDAEMANVISESGGEPDAANGAAEEAFEEGRKIVKAEAGAVRVTADGTESLSEGADVDPDDMPWQPGGSDASEDDDVSGSVKKIKIDTTLSAPPMERKQ